MTKSTHGFAAAVAILIGSAPLLIHAQQLVVGTWSGTVRNATGALRNANTRPASIVIKKVPDPHWRWRTTGDVTTATFSVANGSYELSSIVLKDGKLEYSFASPTKDE